MKSSILFVCLGNICRSPAAEGAMINHLRLARRNDEFLIDSAGTAAYHVGELPDSRMAAAAAQRQLKLTSRARQIKPVDLEQFDLVVAMDRENLSNILRLLKSPTSNVKLLSGFLDDQWPTDVPDPYYGGQEGFEYVLDMLQAACPQVLKYFDQ